MTKIDFKKLTIEAKNKIEKADSLKAMDDIFQQYLGKKGEVVLLTKSLKKLPKEKRAKIGREVNQFKIFLEKSLNQKSKEIKATVKKLAEETEWFDITLPGKKPVLSHLHPLTQVKRAAEEIFQSMGFSIVEGPEIENKWYNFDSLNIPQDHPARDLWDTFYLKDDWTKKNSSRSSNALLLRTHTTPVDVRYMEKNNPPLRIITIGRCFRHEATDASHEVNFHQLDGLMVGKEVSVANFKAVIEEFFKRFFNKEIKIKMRPSYFPFVEPGFEVDIPCLVCGGKGCSACAQTGWMEMCGAGMVHPNVFKNVGFAPREWQGWAFGMGLDRLTMMKYKVNDIRLFYSGDLRFLNQF